MPRGKRSGRRIARAVPALIFSFVAVVALAAPAGAQPNAPEQASDAVEELRRTLSPSGVNGVATVTSTAAGGSSGGSAANLTLFDTEVLVIGETNANAGNSGSSDASVISVLGHEVAGAHSDADGGESSSVTGFAHELCDLSEGQLCLALLYGEANSSDEGGSSSSDAYAALAALCAGREATQTDPGDECDGEVSAAVGESRSSASNDATAGSASSHYESTVARLCLGDDPKTPACDGIGFVLLQGQADSDDAADPAATGFSFQAGGEERFALPHPVPIGDCPETGDGGSCLVFNSGNADAGAVAPADPVVATGGTSTAHAEGFVLQLVLDGNELVRASSTEADTRSGESSADATVLAVLGHEVIGAHAASSGGSAEAETGYLTETCESSEGSLCMALLYGHAMSEDGTTSSSGASDTALGSACLGGKQERPEENCDGSVGVTVAEGHSTASQDKASGAAEATQSTTGADVCLGGENDEGICDGLGIVLLHSEAESRAEPGADGTSSGESSVITVEGGGEEQGSFDDEVEVALPPDCPVGASLVCLTLNQVDTSATAGSASAGATVVDLLVIPRTEGPVASGTASDSATNASVGTQVKGEIRRRPPPAVKGRPLPTTGVPIAVLVLIAIPSLAAGFAARRRSVAA